MSKDQWDFSRLFTGDDDPKMAEQREAYTAATSEFVKKWEPRSDYLQEPEFLAEALAEYEQWQDDWGYPDEYYYFGLRLAQASDDPVIKRKFNDIDNLVRETVKSIQFFELRIAKIEQTEQKKFLGFDGMKPYHHFLERLFDEAKYHLSEEVEQVLMLKSSVSHSKWTQMVSEQIDKEEAEVLVEEDGKLTKKNQTFNQLFALISGTNQEVRDDAAKAINHVLEKHADIAESEINAVLENKMINDNLRGFERPDANRHLSDDIETDVVDAMVKAVSDNFHLSQKYYQIKAQKLGKEKLAYHERNVPIGEIDKSFTYQDSMDLIIDVFNKLDPKFGEIVREFQEQGAIDVFPRKGKRGGAFCAHGTLHQPIFVLLNHNDLLRDVLVIAHELGHGINDYFMQGKQNQLNYDTSLATAEVASTFMEDFVLQELLEQLDDDVAEILIMHKLNDEVSTIFRQVACYKFEQELHATFREQKFLSKDEIGKLFTNHMQSYMGDYVLQDPGSENWWVYWSHIRSFFYNYSYASGLLISKALQAKVKDDHAYISQVKQFLASGLSESPKQIFKNIGIDISDTKFWKQGIDEFASLINEVS